MYAAVVEPSKIAQMLGLRRKVNSIEQQELRTAVLVVPSVVARREGKVVINPRHPDFRGIVAGTPEPVVRDARLFAPRRIPAQSVARQGTRKQTFNLCFLH